MLNEHQQKANEILEQFGIDPYDVPQDDVGEWGYCTVVRDVDGRALFDGDSLAVEAHDWPKGFPVKDFFRHYWAWKGAAV